MSIYDLMYLRDPPRWLEEGFLNMLREFTSTLKINTTVAVIPPNTANKFNASFQDVLDEIGIDRKYHYATLLVNDYYSYNDYRSTTVSIQIPSTNLVDSLYNIYLSS